MRFLRYGVLYTGVFLAAGVLLRGYPSVRTIVADALLSALVFAICLVVYRRRREWQGTHLLFWDAAAVGFLLWIVGEIGFTISSVTDHRSWVQWHTLFSLCGGIGPVVALLARPHRGIRKADTWAIGLDQASYATLMGFVYAYFVLVPSVVPVTVRPSPQTVLLELVQVQRLILFAGLAASAWFARETEWRSTFRTLTIGTGLGFVLRLVTSDAIARGWYYEGSVYDLAWIVPYMAYLRAALRAPASATATEAPPRGGWRIAFVSAAPVLLIPTIGFGLLRVQPIGEAGDSVRLLLTTLSMVAGLGLLTLRLSVQSGQLERADARVRLLAAATEHTGDLILITDSKGRFEHANDACVQALGYARDELRRMFLHELVEHGFEGTVDHIGTEVRRNGVWRGTLVHRRKDGTTFPASSTVVALRNADNRVTHFVGVQRDITEDLKLRDQLVHSERLSAVGELVAGIAHEINNPLQTIIGSVELMLEEPGADHRRDLETVRREASRAGQIVRNLLAFVRKSSKDRGRADLNQIARAVAQLRELPLAQKRIALRLELHQGALPVLVNREEIQQIVLNLVNNAEHALGARGGAIVIRSEGGDRFHALTVEDDGPGIDAELRGRIFEPFFTTKDVGQGTGLGLSLSLGIATAHGGSLELLPDSAGGAAFRLTLPVQAPAETPAPRLDEPLESIAPATGRRQALVVEDEEPVRELLVRLLVRRDYCVTEAASCAEARLVGDGRHFDLVLCDYRLGDGHGAECLRHLTRHSPSVGKRFVFVTGDGGAVGLDAELAGIPVLTKPFSVSELDRVLAGVDVAV